MIFQLNNANYSVGEGLVEPGEIPRQRRGVPSQPPVGDHKGLPYVLGFFFDSDEHF